jgi:hypothetical protein
MNGATFDEDNSLRQMDSRDVSRCTHDAVVVVGSPKKKAELKTLHATWLVHKEVRARN